MDKNKPTIILTTFWDAINISDNCGFMINESIIHLDKDELEVLSIALAKPKSEKMAKFPTLDFFCPSWDLLKDYKRNRNWDSYTKKYRNILIENKNEIASWVDSLTQKVYALCCWENTLKGANCHRKIIYDALKSSSRTKDLVNLVYRHGDKSQYNIEKRAISMLDYMKNIG